MDRVNLFTAGLLNRFPASTAGAAPLSAVNRGTWAASLGGNVFLMARKKRTVSERVAAVPPEADARQLILELRAEMREMFRPPVVPEVAPLKTVSALAREFLPRKRAALEHPDDFEARVKNHLLPAIGEMTAATLMPMHVEDLLNALVDGGLSQQTANHVRDGGRQLVEFAIDNGRWPAANPFGKVKPLELPEANPVMLTKAETGALLAHVRRYLAPLFAVAIYLGARRDTIFNIRCTDVDIGLKVIQLLKTKTGKRITNVPIPEELLPYLQTALAKAKGEWLFPNRLGSQRTRDSGKALNGEILRALVAAKVLRGKEPPHLTFKGLRRLSASLHQEAECHPWVCSKVLGHSQASLVAAGNPAENMTSKHYTFFSEQFVREQLNKLRFHGE